MECIFCAIVAGEAPASPVYEDDQVLAFLDIRPVNPGHTLVISKVHYPSLAALDPEIGKHLFWVGQQVAAGLRDSELRCEGVNVFLADGAAAFQDVFHVHLHVLPRFKGDAFKITADWTSHPARDELDEIAEHIKRCVK
jgi:diadenosine tetraphosphate (Ap4A) HIT family hydrolase